MRSGKRLFSVIAAAALLLLALVVPVSAAKATPTLTQTVCAPGGGPDLQVTITWSGVNANAWSVAIIDSDSSGTTEDTGYQALPKTVSSGSQTHIFTATNAYDGAQAAFAIGYIYMGSPSHIQDSKGFPGGTGGESRPAAGWPTC
jgi:hypothetical protein